MAEEVKMFVRNPSQAVYCARNHLGAIIYEITLPESIAHRYGAIEPFPAGNNGRQYPVGVRLEVRSIGVQYFTVCGIDGEVLFEKVGPHAFGDACLFADDHGLPWHQSGGSELFEPSTRRCWSHKTCFRIQSPENTDDAIEVELDRKAPADMRLIAEQGYHASLGDLCPYSPSQPAAWLWHVGAYLRCHGHHAPTGVRFGGGFVIHANKMLFDISDLNNIKSFPRKGNSPV